MSSSTWRLSMVTGAFGLVAAFAIPAQSATIVVGDNLGASCFEAVDSGKSSAGIDAMCTEALDDVMLAERDRAATHINRGIVRLRLGRSGDAMADFNAALEIEPTMGDAFTNRAAAHVAQGDLQAALDDLNVALGMKLERPEVAYFGRAMVLEDMGRVKEAYYDYKHAAELAPEWDAPRIELTRYRVQRSG